MQNFFEPSRVSAEQLGQGMLAGAVGGLVAAWIMTQYQTAKDKANQELFDSPPLPTEQLHHGTPTQHEPEPATVKMANVMAEAATGEELSRREEKIAGPVVHYAYGTLVGALYGAAAEVEPRVTLGSGAMYGAALWLVGDEIVLPAVGFAPPVTEIPARQHVNSLVVHVLYGVAAELIRDALRTALRQRTRRAWRPWA